MAKQIRRYRSKFVPLPSISLSLSLSLWLLLSTSLVNNITPGKFYAEATSPFASASSPDDVAEDSDAVTLDDFTFSNVLNDETNVWLVAFVAPWCIHCKELLPDWHSASTLLGGTGAMLGIVDGSEAKSLAAIYSVRGYPTIRVFPGGGDKQNRVKDYKGGKTTPEIVQYALDEVDRSGFPPERKIPELTSQSLLDEACGGPSRRSSKLCVLVALPHILDTGANGRNKYRDTLAAAALSVRGRAGAFDFVWFEGGSSQLDLEASLELTFGYPAVAVVSLERGAYSVLRGSFDAESIGSFLSSIASGKGGSRKLDVPLKVVSTEPWDGMDGVVADEEESLADIMGDDWEGEL